jgi:uncharacterized protein YktB (UPF0637 family)
MTPQEHIKKLEQELQAENERKDAIIKRLEKEVETLKQVPDDMHISYLLGVEHGKDGLEEENKRLQNELSQVREIKNTELRHQAAKIKRMEAVVEAAKDCLLCDVYGKPYDLVSGEDFPDEQIFESE